MNQWRILIKCSFCRTLGPRFVHILVLVHDPGNTNGGYAIDRIGVSWIFNFHRTFSKGFSTVTPIISNP